MRNEPQASLAGNHDGLHASRHMVEAPSRSSLLRSTLQGNPVQVAWECVASAIYDVSAFSVAASLLTYLVSVSSLLAYLRVSVSSLLAHLLVSVSSLPAHIVVSVSSLPAYFLVPVAAPVGASFVSSRASLPAHSVALASGLLVLCDAPASALPCASC